MKEGKLLESQPQRQMPFQSFQQKNCFTPLPSPSKRRKTGTTLVILIQFNLQLDNILLQKTYSRPGTIS